MDGKDSVNEMFEIADNVASDQDSEDSNRESADCNDYPDENEDGDSFGGGCGG